MSTSSRLRLILYPLLLVALLWPAIPARSDPASLQTSPPSAPSSAGSLLFIENVGQFDPAVFFKVAGSSGALWLADDGLWVSVTERPESDGSTPGLLAAHAEPEPEPRQGVALHLTLDGADFSRAEPFNRLETLVNYFIGSDPEQWHRDVPAWGGVRYLDAYPGYDLEVTPGEQGWAWRLAGKEMRSASLRADAPEATLRVEGAESLSLADGKLIASTAVGPVALPLLDGTEITPAVEGLQASAPLDAATGEQGIIAAGASDLYYYLNLGGSESDSGYAVAVDSTGNAYIAGQTESDNFPTTPGAYDTEYNGTSGYDVFVSKLGPDGVLAYQTFLGGSSTDRGRAIAVDSAGNAYIAGDAVSDDFPTTPGAYATALAGSYDVFVTKLNAAGSEPIYSTFLGGSSTDYGYAIAVDSAGNAYVTGSTNSSSFPTTAGAYDTGFNGNPQYASDVFVTKLSASGSDLVYSTFLGGTSDERGYGIALDSADSAYVTGETESTDFPTTPSAYDSTKSGYSDAFVTKLNPLGNSLAYSTYLGGGGQVYDEGNSIAVDAAGNAYVTGKTESDDFPTTVGAYDATRDGSDAFVTKFDANGSDLIYSTFLGGTSGDSGYSIALDTTGNAYVTGSTGSADFPTTPGAYDTEKTTNDAAFVTRLNAEGSGLAYSTFLAGSSRGIAVADSGRVWVTGSGNGDAFAASLQCGAAAVEPTPTATTPSSPGEIQLVDNLTLRTEAGHWPPHVGDKIIAHIRVRNSGGENLHVEHIGVRGRRNGSEYWDIGFWTIDLAAGAEWTLDPNNERPLDAGSYSFRISYSLNGTDWVEIGNEVNFTVGSPTPVPTATGPAVTPTIQPTVQPTSQPGQKAWTLMFFHAADNDQTQENRLLRQYGELQSASGNPSVNITSFWDGIASPARYDAFADGKLKESVPQGELSTGAAKTLVDFVAWSRQRYPAEHYALVISDHGSGFGGGFVALDHHPVEDVLTPGEIREALSASGHIDVVYMDACLMGSLESAYQMRGLADYYVASESLTFGSTYPSRFIQAVTSATSPEQLSIGIAGVYRDAYSGRNDTPSTISVVNLSEVENVAAATKSLAAKLRSNQATTFITLWQITTASTLQRFKTSITKEEGDDESITDKDHLADLHHFAWLVETSFPESEIGDAAELLQQALDRYVVRSWAWSGYFEGEFYWDHRRSQGVSIACPRVPVPFYVDQWLDFAAGTNWDGGSGQPDPGDSMEWGQLMADLVDTFNPGGTPVTEPPPPLGNVLVSALTYVPLVMH